MVIHEDVRRFVSQHYGLPLDQVSPNTLLTGAMVADLNWAMVVIDCEKAFTVFIPDSLMDEISTVGKLSQYIEQEKA